jgi:zinc and cadmium transporter
MTITLSAFCTAIVIVSVLGGILPLATVLNHTRLQVYLSFSAGTMLGAAFFHMMPEAVRAGSSGMLRWSAVGLLALFFLERFFSFHHHEDLDVAPAAPAGHAPGGHAERAAGSVGCNHQRASAPDDSGPASRALPWGSAAFGLAVHSLVGGVALASAVVADYQVGRGAAGAGLGVFVATLVHKPADALTIAALMLRSGAPRRDTHLINLGFALMVPLGVGLFFVGRHGLEPLSPGAWTAGALAFSAGTFLCIALSDLLPELQFHSHDRLKLSAALLAGFALMAGTSVLEPEPGPAGPAASKPHQTPGR